MKFFLSEKSRDLHVTWNDANELDWNVIADFFVAAYVNEYRYIYEQADVGDDPLELNDSYKEKANALIRQSINSGLPALDKNVFSLLGLYYTSDFNEQKNILAAYIDGTADDTNSAQKTIEYIKHLLALIYHFKASYRDENKAILNTTVGRVDSIQYVLARFHDKPIGFISCVPNYKTGKIYLRWVNIAPGYHGEGLGRRMFEEINKHYPDAAGFELYTRKLNKGAAHFYPSLGLQAAQAIRGSNLDLSIAKRVEAWLSESAIFPPDDDLITEHEETYVGFHGKLTSRS